MIPLQGGDQASLPALNRQSILRGGDTQSIGSNKKQWVNIDFFDWLTNKSLQTGIIMRDQRDMAKQKVDEYRKQPGPGQYNHSHYSDFWKGHIEERAKTL